MKKFEVEMDLHFTKTVHVQAPDEDAAIHLAEAMVLCTDALPLTNEDMIDLTATATEQDNQADPGTAVTDAEDNEADVFCCGDCTLCALCDEDEDEEERIDELLHKLLEAVKDATDAMDSVLKVADALKELTGENIFSQMMGCGETGISPFSE